MSDSPKFEKPTSPVTCDGLAKWIEGRYSNDRRKWWAEIGEEVLARKTLWLTAACELASQNIAGVNPFKVSATDVFVEKAQKAISKRAQIYLWVGGTVAVLTASLMIWTCVFLYENILRDLPTGEDLKALNFTLLVIRMTTIGALMGGIGYFLIGIARAFLHEGTALYARRHALRYGRLYVYLKGGEIQNFEELEKAFRWNDEIHTAFKDIRADKATRSVAHLVTELGIRSVEAAASAAGSARKKDDK